MYRLFYIVLDVVDEPIGNQLGDNVVILNSQIGEDVAQEEDQAVPFLQEQINSF
jgi:hypothetical protein